MRSHLRFAGPGRARAAELILLAVVCLAIMGIILVSIGLFESASKQFVQDSGQVCAFVPDNGGRIQNGTGYTANVTGVNRKP